jgi:aspartate aminotransferase-like enzyme
VPEKRYLFTPGPTPVPPEVLAALAQPVVHHRGPDFREIYRRCLERLAEVYKTDSDVLLFTSSGTGGLESVVANLCAPGDKVLAVTAGHFGERWAGLAELYGCDVQRLSYEWGETPSPDELDARLDEIGGAKLVLLTHSETSTGVVADVQALAAVAKGAGAMVAVDAVSSLGAVPLDTDSWDLDAVVSGSQKALMTPPGLAFVAVSEQAMDAVSKLPVRGFYFDWRRTQAGQAKLDAPVTPAVSLITALDVALGILLEEGVDAAVERHVRLGRACRAGVKEMGLELFSPDEDRSAVVTTVRIPEGVDAAALLLDLRDRMGVQLIGGQGELKGKVVRIGHIGYYDVFDITTALGALELGLSEAGAEIERGVAVTAALEAFEHTKV